MADGELLELTKLATQVENTESGERQYALGALYRRAGKRQQAREHLTTAGTMFGEMDMRHWLTQAEAELKELA